MSEALFRYYERELLFIRQLAQDFAKQYPAAAGRLLLEPNRSTDPHVERLIESFAILAGRVHHKIDDEFPELTDALLGVLYPHYLAPVPSMAVVQFQLDPDRGDLPNGFRIERHSRLRTQPIHGTPCKFRTGYPVTLWPVELVDARFQPPPFPAGMKPPPGSKAALRLQFKAVGKLSLAELTLDKLRLFLFGDMQLVPHLYEFLFNNVLQVVFRSTDTGSKSPPLFLNPNQCLSPVGFERDEGLMAYPNQSFAGYRLLTEYFTFPHKFLFLDLGGWKQARNAGIGKNVEVVLFLDRTLATLEQGVDAQTFRLGATPVVNLVEQIAEPIALEQTRYEYRVIPDVAHPVGLEVYSVDAVTSVDPATSTTTEYQPFYSFRHGRDRENQRAFWYASRRPSLLENDRGTEVYLNLVDLSFNPRLPAEQVLVVRTTCTNRDLPIRLERAGEELYFELEAAAPLARIRCLRTPTLPLRPPLRRGAYWRLISHLSLNHLSLTDPLEGKQALQEILRLYDFSDPEAGQQRAAVTRQVIEGILAVSSRRVVGRTGAPISSGFSRGV
ncbi:MAG TPA: type VI secretion system baseplate subunit TssF, partial [Gemmataceae bacterium]